MNNLTKKLAIGAMALATLATTPVSFAKEADSSAAHSDKAEKHMERLENKMDKVENKMKDVITKPTKPLKLERNFKVESVSGPMITATNKKGETFTIDATGAKLTRKFGGVSSMAELAVNDEIKVRGTRESKDVKTVKATSIQNISIQKRNAEIKGTIQSIATDGMSFVLKNKAGVEYTVSLTAETKFKGTKKNAVKALADIKVGDMVVVNGIKDKTNNTEKADKVRLSSREKVVVLPAPAPAPATTAPATTTQK